MKLSILPIIGLFLPLLTLTSSAANYFIVGQAGTTPDANNWPLGNVPLAAVDADNGTKYQNFGKENTGYIFNSSTPPEIVTGISFVTAGDAEERDPASYILFGSSTTWVSESVSANWFLSEFTEISSGALSLPSGRSVAGGNVTFENTQAFNTFVLVFPTLKDADSANSMQIAEARLQNANGPLVNWAIAGGQMFPIPEPTSMGLAAAAFLSLGTYRRRSRTS